MVFKRPGTKNWWYKFTCKGERVRESTKRRNKRIAEQIEAAHRTRLAKGEVGIIERPSTPTLTAFAADTFLPFVRVQKADKSSTVVFYERRVGSLLSDKSLTALRLDQIESEHLTAFKARRRATGFTVSTVNRDLATLRRMLHIAVEQKNEPAYVAACEPLIRAVAIVVLDCAIRPDEVHRLRWNEHVRNGAIEVHTGKGTGSWRRIEMTERPL